MSGCRDRLRSPAVVPAFAAPMIKKSIRKSANTCNNEGCVKADKAHTRESGEYLLTARGVSHAPWMSASLETSVSLCCGPYSCLYLGIGPYL